jgi:hypothetical protein
MTVLKQAEVLFCPSTITRGWKTPTSTSTTNQQRPPKPSQPPQIYTAYKHATHKVIQEKTTGHVSIFNSPLAFPSITIVARRLRCAVPAGVKISSEVRSPTDGLVVVNAAGCDVKAQAEAKSVARQKNLMVTDYNNMITSAGFAEDVAGGRVRLQVTIV